MKPANAKAVPKTTTTLFGRGGQVHTTYRSYQQSRETVAAQKRKESGETKAKAPKASKLCKTDDQERKENWVRHAEVFHWGVQLSRKWQSKTETIVTAADVCAHIEAMKRQLHFCNLPRDMPDRCMVYDNAVQRTCYMYEGEIVSRWKISSVPPAGGRNLMDNAGWEFFADQLVEMCFDQIFAGNVLKLSEAESKTLGLCSRLDYPCYHAYVVLCGKLYAHCILMGCGNLSLQIDSVNAIVFCNKCGMYTSLPADRSKYGVSIQSSQFQRCSWKVQGPYEKFLTQLAEHMCATPDLSDLAPILPMRITFGTMSDALCRISMLQHGHSNSFVLAECHAPINPCTKTTASLCIASLICAMGDVFCSPSYPVAPRAGWMYIPVAHLLDFSADANAKMALLRWCPTVFRPHFMQCAYDPRRPPENPNSWFRLLHICGTCGKSFSTIQARNYGAYHHCRHLVRALCQNSKASSGFVSLQVENSHRERIMGLSNAELTRNCALFDACHDDRRQVQALVHRIMSSARLLPHVVIPGMGCNALINDNTFASSARQLLEKLTTEEELQIQKRDAALLKLINDNARTNARVALQTHAATRAGPDKGKSCTNNVSLDEALNA